VLLPSEIRSKGRIALPAEALDKVSWLSHARDSPVDIGIEVRAIGHIEIVPRNIVDSVLARETDLRASLIRRLFVAHIDGDRRLVLPSFFEDRVFPSWSKGVEHNVLLECHEDHVAVFTTEAWMKLVGADPTLGQVVSRSSTS